MTWVGLADSPIRAMGEPFGPAVGRHQPGSEARPECLMLSQAASEEECDSGCCPTCIPSNAPLDSDSEAGKIISAVVVKHGPKYQV
jgi:hypothetical protein